MSRPRSPKPARRSLGAPFWALWGANSLSGLGDGIVLVALPLLAVSITRSPIVVAGLVVTNETAQGMAAIPAGVLADRISKRRMLLGAGTVQVGLCTALAALVLAGADPVWVLYLLAASTGAAYSCYLAVSNSVLPDLVVDDHLESANGWIVGGQTIGEQLAGQGIGGVLFSAGRAFPFLCDALSFAGAWILNALTVSSIPTPRTGATQDSAELAPTGSRATYVADMKVGFRYFWSHPVLRPVALGIGALGFAQAMVLDVLVLYATGPLGLSRAAYGPLVALISTASLVGALSTSRLAKVLRPGTTFALSAVLCVIGYGTLVSSPRLWTAVVGLWLEALAVPVVNITLLTYRQRIVPPEMRARALMSHRTMIILWIAAGGLAGGIVASAYSLRVSFLVAFFVDAAATLTVIVPLSRRLNRQP